MGLVHIKLSTAALRDLRDTFLERIPDFGDFTIRSGAYWEDERSYKEELRQLALTSLPASLFDAPGDPGQARAIVAATRQVLTSRLQSANMVQNLVGWRYHDFLAHLATEGQLLFAHALQNLLYGPDPSPVRAEQFTSALWPLYIAGSPRKPYAQARMLPTFFLMLFDPQGNVAVRTDLFDTAAKRLVGRRILRDAPFSASEYQEVLDLTAAVREHLEAWAWCPADLIDVHSFLWVATRPPEGVVPAPVPHGEVA